MEQQDKKRALLEVRMFLFTIIVFLVLIVLAGIASYAIPAGEYVTKIVNGNTEQIYQTVAQTPIPVWKIILAPIMSLGGPNGPIIIFLIFFILTIGGSFSILNKSGILSRLITDMVEKFADQKYVFLFISITVFVLLGSTLGIIEEVTPMILIFIPLAYRLKWDTVTGVAIPFASAHFGFAAATFNPFTIGTAQKLAGVPLFSGLSLRLLTLVLVLITYCAFMYWYTRRIEKDPTKSVTYGIDVEIKALSYSDDIPVLEGKVRPALTWIGCCFLAISIVVAAGAFYKPVQGLAFPLIAVIFLVMGIGAGLFAGKSVKEVMVMFKNGLIDFSIAIVLILLASSIGWLIHEGKTLATMLHFLTQHLQGMSKELAAVLMYVFQMFMNFLIPSGSAQATLTIPIMAQLGDILGLTRQTTVLAFQFGDGFANIMFPTNTLLMVVLGIAGIKYTDWVKWIFPLQVVIAAICVGVLLIAVNINYV